MWSIYTIGTLSMIVFSLVGMAGWKKGSDNPWEIMGLWLDRRAVVDLLAGFYLSRGIVAQEWEGDIWLGGGEYGPEAGLIGMVFRFVAIVLILLWCRRPKPNDVTI